MSIFVNSPGMLTCIMMIVISVTLFGVYSIGLNSRPVKKVIPPLDTARPVITPSLADLKQEEDLPGDTIHQVDQFQVTTNGALPEPTTDSIWGYLEHPRKK
jgi:hypothetical protein